MVAFSSNDIFKFVLFLRCVVLPQVGGYIIEMLCISTLSLMPLARR